MTTVEENMRRRTGKPTGVPDDAVEAATAINAELGRRVNLPGPEHTGILLAGVGSGDVGDAAQVSIAHSLADIAASLRVLAGRASGADEPKAQG